MSSQPMRPAAPVGNPDHGGDRASSGWWLNFAAGFVPVVAGLSTLLATWVGVARADSAWWTGLGTLGFSFSSVSAAGSGAQDWLELTGSVGGVNVTAAGLAVSAVAWFGLREGQRWSWYFLAFCFLWVGLHDAFMATRFFQATGQPALIMPYTYCVLMLAGLVRTRHVALPPVR